MLPCVRRNEVKMVARDGAVEVLHRCARVDCERFTAVVDESACAGCVMRVPTDRLTVCSAPERDTDFGEPTLYPDGSMTYPRTGWEPPRVPHGYTRSEVDQWTMVPLWPPCGDRELHSRKLTCGCIEVNAICASKDSGKEGRLVRLPDCEGCPARRPKT